MKEYSVKEEGVIRREIGRGWDFRSNWRAKIKNEAATPLMVLFKPLVSLENFARGGDSEDKTEPNKTVEPTPVDVTIPAAQEVAPSTFVAHL
jgi:hypothetical protein